MIGKITTVQELRLEILRRKTLSDTLTDKMKTDYKELKTSANPVNLAKNAFSNNAITTTLISSVVMFGVGYFAKNKIFSKTSGVAKSALSYIIPKVASAIASQTSQAIFSKIKTAMKSSADNVNEDLVKD
jgi:hypothetical protein